MKKFVDWKIVVRSYGRSEQIKDWTLKVLEQQKDLNLWEDLYIFVANEEEKELYGRALVGFPYKDIVIGEKGSAQALNACVHYFPEGTPLIFIDDDMERVIEWTNMEENESAPCEHLGAYFDYCFEVLRKEGISTFTVNYAENWLFKKSKPFAEIRPFKVTGFFWGCFTNKYVHTNHWPHGNDVMRTASILDKDHGVLVLNWLGIKTNYGVNPGGMQSSGDRGDKATKKKLTEDISKQQLKSGLVRKFYFPEPQYVSSAGVYTLKMKSITKLRKDFPQLIEKQFPGYFQKESAESQTELFNLLES